MSAERRYLMTSIFVVLLFGLLSAAAAPAAEDGESLWEKGQEAYRQGRLTEAVGYYRQAVGAYKRANDMDGAGSTLYSLGVTYEDLGEDDRALASYEESLSLYKTLASPLDMGVNMLNIGAIHYRSFGRYELALSYLQGAHTIFRDNNEEEFAALAGYHVGNVYTHLGRYREAVASFEEALRINRKLDAAAGVASVLHNLGRAWAGLGEQKKAIPLFEEALAIDRKLGRKDDLASDLTSLGNAHGDLYEFDKAIHYYEEALSLAEASNLPGRAAAALNNMGSVYADLGRYEKALQCYRDSLEMNRKLDRADQVAVNLNNIGNLYSSLGQYEKILPYYKEALAINRQLRKDPETALNLNNIGMYYYHIGRYDRALEYLDQSLQIRKRLDNPRQVAQSLDNIGAAYLFQKRYRQAEDVFMQRRSLQSRIKGIRLNYSGLIETYIATGRYTEALSLIREMPPPEKERDAYRADYHSQRGRVLKGMGDFKEASRELLASVAVIEEMRQLAGARSGFLGGGSAGGRFRAYRALVESLAERAMAGDAADPQFSVYGKDTAAGGFYFAEATKARTLLEAMAADSKRRGGADLPANLRQQEADLLDSLSRAEQQWDAALRQGGSALAGLMDRKDRLKGELALLVASLRKDYPLYAALHYPKPMAPEDLPLREEEVLFEYALGEDSSFVFVVRKGGVGRVVKIPEGRETLEEKVRRFVEAVSADGGAGFSTKSAKELYDLLLSRPLAGVKPTEKIILVPDGMLGLLPFEALVVEEGTGAEDSIFAADRWTFTYAQSATVLGFTRLLGQGEAKRPLFALGNPVYDKNDPRWLAHLAGSAGPALTGDLNRYAFRGVTLVPKDGPEDDGFASVFFPPLPETEEEVRAVAGLFGIAAAPPDVLLNMAASETGLRASFLGDYRILHFATHADLPGKLQAIREPFLLLGQVGNSAGDDGFLTLSEVLDLKLGADMVVLSACLTGKGKMMEGEGVASLARAFMHAGSRSVVVSLWEVASVETVEFMKAFYGRLAAGTGRADALTLARRDIRARYPNPYYWAVFILHGDG